MMILGALKEVAKEERMDMHARTQYLKALQKEYLGATKAVRGKLLDEAEKRTGLHRKYLIRKLRPTTRWERRPRRVRRRIYDGTVTAALARIWAIFDYPCGQRLAPLLRTEVDRLRQFGELTVTDEVVAKLGRMSSKTIDRALAHEKTILRRTRQAHHKQHPWLYHQIPVRTSADFDRALLGQEQIDLVEHCGSSTAGEYLHTLSVVDIAVGWWEGETVMGRGQRATFAALKRTRARSPIRWVELHPDNDTAFINWHLYSYVQQEHLRFSRSRPFQKNDNCFVEQKNSTHVRQLVGYLRHDTPEEQRIMNDLYRLLRLYKNFFQPVMKLQTKSRVKGKVHRQYDTAKTPYQRVLASDHIPEETKRALRQQYESLNPAELKRHIDATLELLYRTYQAKQRTSTINPMKKLTPRLVTSFVTQPISVRLPT